MTNRFARKITAKASSKAEKETKREVKSLIRTIDADIKKAAKNGVRDFRCKIRNTDIYGMARLHFISKGFRCYEYTSENKKYMAIEW